MISKKWEQVSSLTLSSTRFKNPFITNYEKRNENSRGASTKLIYTAAGTRQWKLKLVAGAEWQTTFSEILNYGNNRGVPDTLQSRDEVNAYQRFYFVHADAVIAQKIVINAGASTNALTYRYIRTSESPVLPAKEKKFNAVISPRLAVSITIAKKISARAIISRGFSSPTLAELRPSEGRFYESLQAESGWNYEIGLRGNMVQNRLQWDVNAYVFKLGNAIVRRTALNGAEYFINAGGTNQKAVEASAFFQLPENKKKFISLIKFGSSLSLYHYRFKNYTINTTNYSGNKLTGVPNMAVANTVDVFFRTRFYLFCSYNYTGKLPLTDANNVVAGSTRLLQCKAGYHTAIKKVQTDFFAGADNILNERYSLGYDINAAGNRFYNAAPFRNYVAGLKLSL
jgi:iron complex outermembrane receptor protein